MRATPLATAVLAVCLSSTLASGAAAAAGAGPAQLALAPAPANAPGHPARPVVAAPDGVAPLYRQIKDWLLVCDNTRHCEARGLVDNERASMRIARDAGPDAPLALAIHAPGRLVPARLRIDGAPTPLQDLPWNTGEVADGSASDLEWTGALPRAAIASLLAGSQLALGEPAQHSVVSLVGLTAVLLAMDEAQGRLDTPGALTRSGPLFETRVLPAVAAPVLAGRPVQAPPADTGLIAAVRLARAAELRGECDADLNERRDSVHALNEREALVLLECQRGAYQSWFMDYRVERKAPREARLLQLPVPAGASMQTTGGLSEPEFDPATGTLSTGARGRGIGDCGYSASWRFDGQEFRLAEYSEQRVCGGMGLDWPVWYRTRAAQ